jgi:DNA-binding PadR family transcriptional regulator
MGAVGSACIGSPISKVDGQQSCIQQSDIQKCGIQQSGIQKYDIKLVVYCSITYTQLVGYVNLFLGSVPSMALAHTILAVLSHAPFSGYDISKQFEEGVGCYWQASQQQIYRELGKMEQQGWVTFERIPQEGKPDKKIYQMTEAGRQELRRWYAEPTEPTPIREDLLVKVLAAPFMPRELLIQELKHRRQMHTEQLLMYQAKETERHGCLPIPIDERFRYLTLRRGIRFEQEWIDWCDEVLDFLKQQENSSPTE